MYGTTDKNAAAKLFDSAATSGMSTSDLHQIDAAEIKFWVCDDGYLHQTWMSIDGTIVDQPNQKIGIRMRQALFDYNGNFSIVAPPNPAKLEQPSLGGGVFQTIPSSGSAPAGERTAMVFNGGNIRQKGGNRRAAPSMKAEVLGLVRTGETIQLLAKTKNGAWYYARCRCGALGWVHASLLKVDPKVAGKVPVA